MESISIDTILHQIDHDYNQSIVSVRQIFADTRFTGIEKRIIARLILSKIDSMKNELEIWA